MHVRRVGKGPLFPADGSVAERLGRRVKGIGLEAGAFLLVTLLFPLLLAGAAVVDLALWLVRRKPWMAVRLVCVAWWFLFAEMRAYAALLWIYASTGGPLGRGSVRRRRLIYGLRIHWCRSHLAGAKALFGMKLDVEGEAGPGPFLLFIRHASAPVPVRRASPDYTPRPKAERVQGSVLLSTVVLEDGSVSDVRVTKSLHPELDEQAVAAMKRWEFKPGTRDGKPVAVRITCEMAFTLK
jgi:TonB family protein